jgi:hypothetical protein
MESTPNLDLPYIMPSQAQKHVTHNEALRLLDAIVQLSVKSRTESTPPQSPADGDRYIVAEGASEDWQGHDLEIAAYQDGAWAFYPPNGGWTAWVEDEKIIASWNGANWNEVCGPDGKFDTVSINGAISDVNNRLALTSPAVLFDNAGYGHQLKINKNLPADTASMLFQTGYSGRAEFGLTGDDDWHVKVSPDGANWVEALKIDSGDGSASINALRHLPTGSDLSSILFTPGGDGIVSIYRVNPECGQNPRSAAIASVTSDIITLTTSDAALFFDAIMENVSYLRIWNLSKSPEESAWVKASPGTDQLQVLDAANIAAWEAGDTIQAGDPTSITPGRCITLDISPMLVNLFGQAFRQRGIVVKANILAGTGGSEGDTIAISPTGSGGSFVGASSLPSSSGVTIIACTELSPLSNSNLVRIRETISGTAGIRLVSSLAVLA